MTRVEWASWISARAPAPLSLSLIHMIDTQIHKLARVWVSMSTIPLMSTHEPTPNNDTSIRLMCTHALRRLALWMPQSCVGVCVGQNIRKRESDVQKMGVRLTGLHPLVEDQVLCARHWFSCLQDRWSARDIVVCHPTSWESYSASFLRDMLDLTQNSTVVADLTFRSGNALLLTECIHHLVVKDKWCRDIIVIWNTCELCEGMTQRSGGNEWPFPFLSFSWSWTEFPRALQDDERKLVLFHS